jgi:hypothetical protein
MASGKGSTQFGDIGELGKLGELGNSVNWGTTVVRGNLVRFGARQLDFWGE